jgi:hypothetical protein
VDVKRLAALDMYGTRGAARRRELRLYTVLQLWILVPASLVIMAARRQRA